MSLFDAIEGVVNILLGDGGFRRPKQVRNLVEIVTSGYIFPCALRYVNALFDVQPSCN